MADLRRRVVVALAQLVAVAALLLGGFALPAEAAEVGPPYNSAEFIYDARADVALDRSVLAAEELAPAGQPENTDLAATRIAGCVYDLSRSFVAPSSLLDDAAFAQTTFRETFSSGGRFAGQSIDDVAGGLRSGALSPGDVPIEFIVRDGNSLILNTRSAQALTRAGVPRSQWLTTNVTGNAAAEARLTAQLARNGLDSSGTLGPISSGG